MKMRSQPRASSHLTMRSLTTYMPLSSLPRMSQYSRIASGSSEKKTLVRTMPATGRASYSSCDMAPGPAPRNGRPLGPPGQCRVLPSSSDLSL